MPWTLTGNLRGPPGAGGSAVRKYLSADLAAYTSATVLSNVAGMNVPLAANQAARIQAQVFYTTAAATTGILLGLAVPAGAALKAVATVLETATTARKVAVLTTTDQLVAGAASAGASAVMEATVDGFVLNGATPGDVNLRYRSEVAASGVTIRSLSNITVD